ncbi:hypothetical protein [Acinetobacter larvae]|uniref:Uncharacterized protein n=1 Tax=Acinetobacter larvae TaxID=1789224 RepID=A0A1B2LY49_9GAMM|nr:hypothetical protein [Acinetobacter larvae]AOA57855.1 hypothetical protein BFG52_05460 [Acinetobacter larvae]
MQQLSPSLQTQLLALKHRQRRVRFWAVFAVLLACLMLALFLVRQQLAYALVGLGLDIEYLHLPVSLALNISATDQVDGYLDRALSWVGWFLLKIPVSMIAAFVFIRVLRLFKAARQRMQSKVLTFVAWLIGFILAWSVLSYVQYAKQAPVAYAGLIQYKQNIQQSPIANYLKQSQQSDFVQSYVLAQTALLHRPIDRTAADFYLQRILPIADAERISHYGLQEEQLWTMQQQVYAKNILPNSPALQSKINRATQYSALMYWLSLITFGGASFVALCCAGLARHLQQRLVRIQQALD